MIFLVLLCTSAHQQLCFNSAGEKCHTLQLPLQHQGFLIPLSSCTRTATSNASVHSSCKLHPSRTRWILLNPSFILTKRLAGSVAPNILHCLRFLYSCRSFSERMAVKDRGRCDNTAENGLGAAEGQERHLVAGVRTDLNRQDEAI